MTDVVWVAFISAGAALITALVTQLLATTAATRHADRAEKREALNWQRSEEIRREDVQREAHERAAERKRVDMQKQQDLLDARLRELWEHALTARWRVLSLGERAVETMRSDGSAKQRLPPESLPATAAEQAYAVALLGLTSLRPFAKDFYEVTTILQLALDNLNTTKLSSQTLAFAQSFQALEKAVAEQANGLLSADPGVALHATRDVGD